MAWTYKPGLDGLRSVAVYLVVAFHCGVAALGGGQVGVDLFFVLSGFLVASILLDEQRTTGTVRLARFYARRVRRLLPAAVVAVAATSVVFVLVAASARREPMIGDAQSALLYVANWHFLAQSNDYFATDVDRSPFLHFWSLSIEEQFYVAFPVLLLLAGRVAGRGGVRRHALTALVGTALVLSVGAQLWWAARDPNHAYYGTDARVYQLLAGVLLAIAVQPGGSRSTGQARLQRRAAGPLAALGLVALVYVASGWLDVSASTRGLLATAASVLTIAALVSDEGSLPSRALSGRLPVYLGRVSYGTYLWHWPVVAVLAELVRPPAWILVAIVAAVSTGLAALSYEVLEHPIRRSAWLSRVPRATVAAGLAASLLVALALVPPTLGSDRKPVLVASGGTTAGPGQGAGRPVPALDWGAIARDHGMRYSYCAGDDRTSCVVHRSEGRPHVMVVGDSHGVMIGALFRRFAAEHDFTLSFNVTVACPWQVGLTNRRLHPDDAERCAEARDDLYEERIAEMGVDVVVLAEMPRDSPAWQQDLVTRDGRAQPHATKVLDATRETLGLLERAGVRVVILEAAIMPGFDPLSCLSGARRTGECRVPTPAEPPVSDALYRTLDAESERVSTVNINPVMCPRAPVCEPMFGDVPVWRDNAHYSPEALDSRADELWAEFEEAGLLG